MGRANGFTLIELLIVLILIGILSSITYPVYNRYIIKVRRLYAVSALSDIAGKMESFYIKNGTYRGAEEKIDRSKCGEYYQIEIKYDDEDGYILMAIPLGSQRKDLDGGILTLDNMGGKGSSLDIRL